jgi:hypothetical protein
VVDRYQNLRGVDAVNEYPFLVTWLTEFIGAHIFKKISAAYEKSVAAAGSGEYARRKERGDDGNYVIKEYFGDALLYACYGFYDRFKTKPKDWKELFEFLKFIKVKTVYREMAVEAAKANQNG